VAGRDATADLAAWIAVRPIAGQRIERLVERQSIRRLIKSGPSAGRGRRRLRPVLMTRTQARASRHWRARLMRYLDGALSL